VRQRIARLSFIVALLSLPAEALAQVTPAAGFTPPDETQSIAVGAVIFYDYTYTKSPQTTVGGVTFNPNSFNLTRTYINVTGRISSVVSFRVTPDIVRETIAGAAVTGGLVYRVKYGYAQFNFDRWTGGWTANYARLGIQQTPFIDGEEGVYRYRFQGTVYAERDGGLSSADAGASYHSNLPNNYGDFHVGIYNGEGYSRVETNDQKAIMMRGTVRPFAQTNSGLGRGLRFTGYYHNDHSAKDLDRNRAIFSTWLEQRRYNAGFDYMNRWDEANATSGQVKSGGYSIFVTPFFQEKGNGLEALIRYDQFKVNKDLDPRQDRLILGVAYWFPHAGGNATAALLFDYEQVTVDKPAAPVADQERFILHGLINF